MQYTTHAHSVGDNFWHIEWCPKYRYQMFGKDKYKNLADECIRTVAVKHKIIIHELQVMPDHLHAVISIPDTMSISHATQLLKGGSSYLFFRAHERARLRYPQGHLWSAGTFRGGCEPAASPRLWRVEEKKKIHHRPRFPPKPPPRGGGGGADRRSCL